MNIRFTEYPPPKKGVWVRTHATHETEEKSSPRDKEPLLRRGLKSLSRVALREMNSRMNEEGIVKKEMN